MASRRVCGDKWKKISQWSEDCSGYRDYNFICHKLHLNQKGMLFAREGCRLWWVSFFLTIDSLQENKDSCWLSHLITWMLFQIFHIWHSCSFSPVFQPITQYMSFYITLSHTDIVILDNLLPLIWWICLWNVKEDQQCHNMSAPWYHK